MIDALSYKCNGLLKGCIATKLSVKVVFWVYSHGPWPLQAVFPISRRSQSHTDLCPVLSFLLRKYKALTKIKCGFPPADHKGQTAMITANSPWDIFFDSWFYSFTLTCIWISWVPHPPSDFLANSSLDIYNIALAMAVNVPVAFFHGYLNKAMWHICWAT